MTIIICMVSHPPRSTRTVTLFPCSTHFQASRCCVISGATQSSSIGDAVDRITPESMKPLAIALGDPAGIGPEIVAKAWSQRKQRRLAPFFTVGDPRSVKARSEEHTSELQSLMSISYAVFCLKKKKRNR